MDGKLILALIYAPFKALGNVLKIVLSNKILLIAFIVIVGFVVVKTQFMGKDDDTDTTKTLPAYQLTLPPVSIAPRIVQTTTRYFPYSTFQDTSAYLTLTDYYVYTDNTWQHSTTPMPIPKARIVQIFNR